MTAKYLPAISAILTGLFLCLGAHVAVAGTGDKIYVALDRDVAVADPNSLDAWGSIKVGKRTANLKVSPDNRFVYVVVHLDKRVKCIDVSMDTVVKEVETGPGPYPMDLTPDGTRLLVGTMGTAENLIVIDTGSFKVVNRLNVGGMPQALRISPDGATAYVVVGDPEAALVAVDIKSMKPGKRIDLPNQVYDMDISPDGKELYASSVAARKVVIIDLEKMKVSDEIEAYGNFGVAVSKDGKELWFPGPEGRLTAYSLKEQKVLAEMPFPGRTGNRKLAFSPDGKRLFAWPAGDERRVINVYDTALKKKTGEITVPDFPRNLAYIER